MYRYIGNKAKLLPIIMQTAKRIIGEIGVVADIMAGTGVVSLEFRREGYSVIASDMMTYSKHHLNINLLVNQPPDFAGLNTINSANGSRYEDVLLLLNSLEPVEGYFYNEFSPGGIPQNGSEPRKYFIPENASKIDAMREQINQWLAEGKLTEIEESLLKHTLIMATNKVANISGTYGYFLSSFIRSSLDNIVLLPVQFEENDNINHTVIQGFAEVVAPDIRADLCYIDPPYMKRQYAANYHILETIARGDYPEAVGKSGLRDWWDQHSKFCTKTRGLDSFERVISSMHCQDFIISYSEDGLFPLDTLISCFEKHGTVSVDYIDNSRFRSNGSPLPKQLQEYVIHVRK
ncbi:MAG: DNA adenine methylase [Bacillota bacterium]|nr:DNA adenine methylase [Bacillota bacterium]MDW7670942.1 DNA adenine methylase [Bacillota bacterium]